MELSLDWRHPKHWSVTPYNGTLVAKFPENDVLRREIRNFRREGFTPNFLADNKFLDNFKREKNGGSDQTTLPTYSISMFDIREGYWSGRDIGNKMFFSDTPYQFVLMSNELYLAVLGFEFVDIKSILISQIQGIEKRGDLLRPLRWANALVNVTLDWASRAELKEVMILPSSRNKYFNFGGGTICGRLGNYYDRTAKQEGFVYDKSRQVYVKPVISSSQ